MNSLYTLKLKKVYTTYCESIQYDIKRRLLEMINYSKLLKRIDVNELSKVVSKSTIERIKVGANMRLSTLEKICKHFKVQINEIVEFK